MDIDGDMIKKNISKNIVKFREKVGLTQKDLANQLKVTPSRISNWEQGANCPTIDILFEVCKVLNVSINDIYGVYPDTNISLSYMEQEHIKKYRFVSEHSPDGADTVNTVLDREYSIAGQLKEKSDRIAELESSAPKIIDIEEHKEHLDSRLLEYHRSASAGGGVFILGDEDVEQVGIPNVPGADEGDYAIKISGNSMEPDYYDGEVALVARDAPIKYGDVGIFIIDGKAYIKEYGKTELISRNPESGNIIISEYANIVCMGKVVGKIREEDMIRL